MAQNNITELRAHLFDALKALKEGTLELDRAKAVAEISQTIINSAKVEIEHLKVTGGTGTTFIQDEANPQLEDEQPKGYIKKMGKDKTPLL